MGIDAMTLYRLGRKLYLRGVPVLPAVLRKAIHYLHGSYIPVEAEIGEGTQLGYGGMGVVIHKDARIGRHCLISHQVTIGGRSGLKDLPVIGDYVRIGAGAKILGNIQIGDFAVIGANAVVVKDVAPGAVVGGIPAREIRKDPDPLATYEREMGLRPQPARHPEAVKPIPSTVSSAAQ
ncbi:serine O-acetyltransferase [Vitiosangium sp. GDMCC 1.1324]|uniref:serine O-acetyltransferase n=1 Tax=Vitiosangium sp. (strain GDMCC 1.1324) TaxID=2138576 RepID=UPI000D3C9B91|nr:serine acetyltransferase [Vitiosangium sp. GDMCC 1.1324]PTL77277.1 serine acetyltransferase [Vitiosangium sp. GDMCC 1.1324]